MGGTICQNIKLPTLTQIPSSVQLSTWGRFWRLGYKQFSYFLLNVNSLKKFVVSKAKFKKNFVFKKWPFFHTHYFQKYSNWEDQVWGWFFL